MSRETSPAGDRCLGPTLTRSGYRVSELAHPVLPLGTPWVEAGDGGSELVLCRAGALKRPKILLGSLSASGQTCRSKAGPMVS